MGARLGTMGKGSAQQRFGMLPVPFPASGVQPFLRAWSATTANMTWAAL